MPSVSPVGIAAGSLDGRVDGHHRRHCASRVWWPGETRITRFRVANYGFEYFGLQYWCHAETGSPVPKDLIDHVPHHPIVFQQPHPDAFAIDGSSARYLGRRSLHGPAPHGHAHQSQSSLRLTLRVRLTASADRQWRACPRTLPPGDTYCRSRPLVSATLASRVPARSKGNAVAPYQAQ